MINLDGPVYVASSWRNEHQPEVVEALRANGIDCYDFRNPADGNHGFSWKECGPKGMSDERGYVHGDTWLPGQIVTTLDHPIARRGFDFDFGAMRAARACVLVMPCGRSAHIEAGYFVGAGKPLHVLLTGRAEPELMWRMAYESGGGIYSSLLDVIGALKPRTRLRDLPRCPECGSADVESFGVQGQWCHACQHTWEPTQ